MVSGVPNNEPFEGICNFNLCVYDPRVPPPVTLARPEVCVRVRGGDEETGRWSERRGKGMVY
jgi:hypothetical protein